MLWRKLICQSVGQEQLAQISTFLIDEPRSRKSPIDQFYEESREILRATPTTISTADWIGPINAVAIVSITENYFRSILVEILNICHVSRTFASKNNINLGSAMWHTSESIIKGAFENTSFSDSDKIIEITKKYIGHDLNGSDISPILKEFSKVCELRHGIVHSGRYLAGKNAIILKVPSTTRYLKISIGYGQLQSIAAICTTLVVAYNKAMFELICHRWATAWRSAPTWNPATEDSSMKMIWQIFFSKIDKQDGNIEEIGSWKICKNLIKSEYNLP